MLIIAPETISNPKVLETRSLPKKFFGRVTVFPKQAGAGQWGRLIVEIQFLRYLVALIPFAVLPFLRSDLALPITQAPVAMVLLIALVEMRVLRYTRKDRARLASEDEVARRLDTLRFRARAILRKIAARHELSEGELRLVVEQSELARIRPLTLVTVQTDHPNPRVLSLDAGDRAVIEDELFDTDFTERDLAMANQREETFIRDIVQEARGVSAHARLSAYLDKRAAGEG